MAKPTEGKGGTIRYATVDQLRSKAPANQKISGGGKITNEYTPSQKTQKRLISKLK